MKISLVALLGACALASVTGPSVAQPEGGYRHWRPFAGDWSTSEGDMTVDQHEDRISGGYAKRGGRVRGEAHGDHAEGIWAQDVADQSCDEERMGTHYWGRFEWHLSEDGQRFYGRYSYCDADPNVPWNGARR